jgi:hypothetical protein
MNSMLWLMRSGRLWQWTVKPTQRVDKTELTTILPGELNALAETFHQAEVRLQEQV